MFTIHYLLIVSLNKLKNKLKLQNINFTTTNTET